MEKENYVEYLSALPRFRKAMLEDFSFEHHDIDINKSEEMALMYLHRNNSCIMSEVSRMICVEKSTFTAIADSLIEKGLVERSTLKNDRRKSILILTLEGKIVTTEIIKAMNEHICYKYRNLNQDEINEIISSLKTLYKYTNRIINDK